MRPAGDVSVVSFCQLIYAQSYKCLEPTKGSSYAGNELLLQTRTPIHTYVYVCVSVGVCCVYENSQVKGQAAVFNRRSPKSMLQFSGCFCARERYNVYAACGNHCEIYDGSIETWSISCYCFLVHVTQFVFVFLLAKQNTCLDGAERPDRGSRDKNDLRKGSGQLIKSFQRKTRHKRNSTIYNEVLYISRCPVILIYMLAVVFASPFILNKCLQYSPQM